MSLQNILSKHIKAAKNGDQTAYRYLLNLYWTDVHNFIKSKTDNDQIDTEDIAIITFSKAFDKINTFDESYVFKTWLFTIAKNLIIDEFRKKQTPTVSIEVKHKELYALFDENPTPEDLIIIEQNLAELKKNIKQLKPKYQKVINLRYFQELSYQEIADASNESINNVKVKLLRAKKLLAEIITNHSDEN